MFYLRNSQHLPTKAVADAYNVYEILCVMYFCQFYTRSCPTYMITLTSNNFVLCKQSWETCCTWVSWAWVSV